MTHVAVIYNERSRIVAVYEVNDVDGDGFLLGYAKSREGAERVAWQSGYELEMPWRRRDTDDDEWVAFGVEVPEPEGAGRD